MTRGRSHLKGRVAMIPEPAQVARGCGILVLETGSHVGNEWGAQEGTGLCLDLKPARQSAGQNISQTTLGPWRRPRHPPRDKVGLPLRWAASTRTGSVPGSGGSRWFCQYLHLPTPCLCMNSLFSFLPVQVALCGTLPRSRSLFVFYIALNGFFHSYQTKLAGRDNSSHLLNAVLGIL